MRHATGLSQLGDVAGGVVGGGGDASQGIGFAGDVAKGIEYPGGLATQGVGDAGFVVVGVVGVLGDAACRVGDLADVATRVVLVGGGVAHTIFDGLLSGAEVVGDGDGVAQRIGLLDDAAVFVIFGLQLQAAGRVGPVGQRVGQGGVGVAVDGLRAVGLGCRDEVALAVIGVAARGVARARDLSDSALSVSGKLQAPAT